MYRYYEVAVTRYFDPLLSSMYTDSSQTVKALKEWNLATESDFKRTLAFQIESMREKYEFLLSHTNETVSQVRAELGVFSLIYTINLFDPQQLFVPNTCRQYLCICTGSDDD